MYGDYFRNVQYFEVHLDHLALSLVGLQRPPSIIISYDQDLNGLCLSLLVFISLNKSYTILDEILVWSGVDLDKSSKSHYGVLIGSWASLGRSR